MQCHAPVRFYSSNHLAPFPGGHILLVKFSPVAFFTPEHPRQWAEEWLGTGE
jgi:hypothetical protein